MTCERDSWRKGTDKKTFSFTPSRHSYCTMDILSYTEKCCLASRKKNTHSMNIYLFTYLSVPLSLSECIHNTNTNSFRRMECLPWSIDNFFCCGNDEDFHIFLDFSHACCACVCLGGHTDLYLIQTIA